MKELRRKRAILTDDILPVKNDNYYREKNLKRYRKILNKRRIPDTAKSIVEQILKNYSIEEIPNAMFTLKRYIPDDLLEVILDLLLEYNIITKEEYRNLSSGFNYF